MAGGSALGAGGRAVVKLGGSARLAGIVDEQHTRTQESPPECSLDSILGSPGPAFRPSVPVRPRVAARRTKTPYLGVGYFGTHRGVPRFRILMQTYLRLSDPRPSPPRAPAVYPRNHPRLPEYTPCHPQPRPPRLHASGLPWITKFPKNPTPLTITPSSSHPYPPSSACSHRTAAHPGSSSEAGEPARSPRSEPHITPRRTRAARRLCRHLLRPAGGAAPEPPPPAPFPVVHLAF